MRFIDELIVKTATTILRGYEAVETGFTYVQFIVLMFIGAMIGATALAMVLAAAKAAIFGG